MPESEVPIQEKTNAAAAAPVACTASEELEKFRPYLRILAQTQLHDRFLGKVDPSDIVQQTMLQAHQARAQFRGSNDAEMAGWLRQILANVLMRISRDLTRDKRNVMRERSFDAPLAESSMRLANLLAADGSSPSVQVVRHEMAALVAKAMLDLPEDQRKAIMLKYWEGDSLAQIGEKLGRSVEAVAGLLYRGLQKLRAEVKVES